MANEGFNTQQYGMPSLGGGEGDLYPSAAPPMPEPPGNFGMPMEDYGPPAAEEPPPPPPQQDYGTFELNEDFSPSGGSQKPAPTRSQKRQGRLLASAPGTTMMRYLFARSQLPKLSNVNKPAGVVNQKMPIYTQSPEALKAALNLLGVRSERNPLGIDVSLDDAKTALFGEKSQDMDDIDKTQFKNDMETGDDDLDKKNVRQFVNSDGSTTYEVVNPDKSVMARFTIGEYKGKKVFVPGGYTDYAEQLRKMFSAMSTTNTAQDDFEKLRRMLFQGKA